MVLGQSSESLCASEAEADARTGLQELQKIHTSTVYWESFIIISRLEPLVRTPGPAAAALSWARRHCERVYRDHGAGSCAL